MRVTVFVSAPNLYETELDELRFCCTVKLEYPSAAIKIKQFLKDVQEICRSQFELFSIYKPSNQHPQSLVPLTIELKLFETLETLRKFAVYKRGYKYHWQLHLEAIPARCEIIPHIMNKIPMSLSSDTYNHKTIDQLSKSIEWNDFDQLLIEYCSHFAYYNELHLNTPPKVYDHSMDKIFASTVNTMCLDDITDYLLKQYCKKRMIGDIKLTAYICMCIVNHLIHVHNVYGDNIDCENDHDICEYEDPTRKEYDFLMRLYAMYCRMWYLEHKKRDLDEIQLAHAIVDYGGISACLQLLTATMNGKKIIKLFLASIHDRNNVFHIRVQCDSVHDACFKVLQQANNLCQIHYIDTAGECLYYFCHELMYAKTEKINMNKHRDWNNNDNHYHSSEKSYENKIARKFDRQREINFYIQSMLKFLILFMLYCDNLSINCLLRYKMLINNIYIHYKCKSSQQLFGISLLIAQFILYCKIFTYYIYCHMKKNNNDRYNPYFRHQQRFKQKLSRLRNILRLLRTRISSAKREGSLIAKKCDHAMTTRQWDDLPFSEDPNDLPAEYCEDRTQYDYKTWPQLTDKGLFVGVLVKLQPNCNYNKQIDIQARIIEFDHDIADIIDKALKISLINKKKKDVNIDHINSLERLANSLQLGCIVARKPGQILVDKRNFERHQVVNSNKGPHYQILTWRNICRLKECLVCHKKHLKLRKCRKCKRRLFCSKKCQKIDWKHNDKHRKNCRCVQKKV